jgi:hypothetical protein
MHKEVLEKIFEGFEQLAMLAVVFFLICVITVPLAIWKLVELIW